MSTAAAPAHPVAGGPVAARQRTLPLTTIVFGIAVVVGFVFRARVLTTTGARMNADFAVVYLQALGAEHGHVWVFFWGQAYGGTILQLSTGALMRVTRTSPYVFQWYTSLWWLAGAFAWRAVARRVWNVPAGDLAGAIVWIAGARLVVWSLADAFYGPSIALSGALIALVLRPGRPSRTSSLLAGLVAGVFVWTATFGFAFALPAAVVFLVKRPRPTSVAAAVVGGIVGAAPWLAYGLRNDWATLRLPHSPWHEVPHRSWMMLSQAIPSAFPDRMNHTLGLTIGWVIVAVLVVGLLTGLVRRSAGDLLLVGCTVLSIVAVAYSINPLDSAQPAADRYSVIVLPAVLTFLGGWSSQLRPAVRTFVGAAVVATVSVEAFVGAGSLYAPLGDARFGTAIPALTTYLEQHRMDVVWANYWTSYPVIAQSGGRIIAAPIAPSRYPPYFARAEAVPDTIVVVVDGYPADHALQGATGLPSHTRTVVADAFAVYAFAGHVPQAELPLQPF